MKKNITLSAMSFILLVTSSVLAQSSNNIKKSVDELNRAIDHAVVKKDIQKLDDSYASDFVFTHGTGLIDSKESWLRNVKRPEVRYISREHDSTDVELHDNIAIVTGKLTIKREDKAGTHDYGLRYVRVFALRNKSWKMISHRTVKEWHN